MFFKSKKLSNRIILLVLALELTSISFWGYATYSNSRDELLTTIGKSLYEVALRMDSKLNGFLEPSSIHIKALGDAIRGLNLSAKDIAPIVNEMFNARPEIDEVSILNYNGQELYRHGRLHAYQGQDLRNLSTDPLVLQAIKKGASIGPITFSKYYEPLIRMVFSISNNRKKSLLIDVTLNLKWMWSLAQQQIIGDSGYVYIVDADGKLISYPDHSLVLAGRPVMDKLPKSLFKNHDDHSMKIYQSLTGNKVAGISHYDGLMKSWIIVELPTAEGLAPLNRMLHWFIFIFICAALFTVATVLIFVNITMRPLQSIMQAISRISNGETGVQVAVKTGSELSTLADGINNMACKLDERIQLLTESQTALLASKTRYQQLNKSLEESVRKATQELRDANIKLVESAANAESANESKSMLLANTSHELRTPLNAIIGYSELICESAEESNNLQLLKDTKKIIYSARYLLDLINNLLDLSKIEKGKLQLFPEEFKLQEFLNAIVDIINPLAEKNNNKFTLTYHSDVNIATQDITRLRQVIINLVGNACKFTENGKVNLTVNNISINNIDFLQFQVTDTGIGMTKDQIDKLFVVFQQADAKATRRYGGSGLGLALSKQLALLMKGDIYASSVFGEGSDFTLVIPRYFNDSRLTRDTKISHFGNSARK